MKKGLRRLISIFLASALSIGTSINVFGTMLEDVPAHKWYAEPIFWAVENGIASGTSKTTFSPNQTCTKAQVLTFLWRACGSPMIEMDNPFWDIDNSKYYYRAALWAYEKGMQAGDYFEANEPCTRSMAVRFMWQVAGSPQQSQDTPFSDVIRSQNYTQAVVWAVKEGIVSGTSPTTFSPYNCCTRAEIMAFLYRGRDILENLDNLDTDVSDEYEPSDEADYDIFNYDEDVDDWEADSNWDEDFDDWEADSDWDETTDWSDDEDWDNNDWDDDTDWDDEDDWDELEDFNDDEDWDDNSQIDDEDKQVDTDDFDFWDIMSKIEVSDVFVDDDGNLKFNFRFT